MSCEEEFQNQDKNIMIITAKNDSSATQNPCLENCPAQNEMLVHLAHSRAIFKSQQKDEPELSFEEKKTIALNLLEKSPFQFLCNFGRFLKEEHLSYFEKIKSDNYEISFYLKRLHRYFNRSTRKKDVKNRRYEALKSLVEKGEYFSETEMMKRNPLLYDQLVGRYLTEEQKKVRDNIDTQNITFVNLLMESIDRDIVRNFKQDQQDAEDEVDEECDSDEESEEENNTEGKSILEEKKDFVEKKANKNWGEMSHPKDIYESEKHQKQRNLFWYQIPSNEQNMLKQEFVSNMYQSFLDGRDIDFDYR